MKQFFFGNQASTLCTLCALMGLIVAIALPPLEGYAYREVLPHMAYWLILPVVGTIGLIKEHHNRRQQNQRRSMIGPAW